MINLNKIIKQGLAAALWLLPFFLSNGAKAEGLRLITDEESEILLEQIIKPGGNVNMGIVGKLVLLI